MEVEPACDQEDHGLDRLESRESASASLGSLKQAIERFQKPIGLPGLCPRNDAVEMTAHERSDVLHWLNLGAHDAGAPMQQHRAHHIDLLAFEDFAQLLLVDPGPGSAHGGHPGDQRVQIGCRLGLELVQMLGINAIRLL